MKIGEVAERTELSIRSLRHWDEVGLVSPSAHSPGGFRLYTETDVERILLIRRMKPLGFSLERMREFCRALDDRAASRPTPSGPAASDVIAEVRAEATERLERLRTHLAYAEEFVEIVERLR
ncbi:MerR family transcriptional regulator [Dietzia sp. ANT_WB102]|uniref:MerR family transcriptional regulator n=1 Tax=Dietzia sp. ANT_WB102 TaxID=2597345 RepID=UPI0011ECC7C5|nr:MerR family transcriptional regulator [Dietzia sp. ANT_WB102]KAA0919944.1 MerR family transcriptional regulator [Dietzia sp. ANT_WB102]